MKEAQCKLNVLDKVPSGLLNAAAPDLLDLLGAPTLIALPGAAGSPLVVSTLLHGNEPAGLLAMQALLKKHLPTLPRPITWLIGNVMAAHEHRRRLDSQPDFNRIWNPGSTPEHQMAAQVLDVLSSSGAFACVDIHNTTGRNPCYACVTHLDIDTLTLARGFERRMVYASETAGRFAEATRALAPSVTVECGPAGSETGVQKVLRLLSGLLDGTPLEPLQNDDLELYESVGTVKVRPECSLSVGKEVFGGANAQAADVQLVADLDKRNWQLLLEGESLGRVQNAGVSPIVMCDQEGHDVTTQYFDCSDGEIRAARDLIPSMLTCDPRIIAQDCLCYVMYHRQLSELQARS